jgi:hypothetical protein
MREGSHRGDARRRLSLGALALLAAACSADPDAHDEHGARCDDDTQMPYKGFCVPREDGGGSTAGTGGEDGGADSSPGIETGACPEEAEERPCYPDRAPGAGEGPCKHGTQRCIDSEWSDCDGDVAPSTELCNDVDDDCNGTKDDIDPVASCMTGQEGLCGAGTESCEGGRTRCASMNEPEAEACNGEDDDCDGQADEGTALPCYPDDVTGCTENDDGSFTCVGQCATGVQDCAGGAQGECGGATVPTGDDGCTASGDTAYDDDCDGIIDDDCDCTNGDTQPCYGGAESTLSVAPCAAGTQTCVAQKFGPCMGDRVPEQETCENDGVDDDCDGQSDEIPNRGMACTDEAMEGVCHFGEYDCEDGAFGCKTPASSTEQCNGLDDDCDGARDNGFLLLSDALNCGACGEECSGELTCCGGQCVDVTADEDHCGACGDPCGGGATCCDGTCVDTDMHADHCGACGEGCGAGRDCCGGACVDTRVSTDHCGACHEGCDPGEACCTGECAAEDSPVCATCAEDCEDIGEQCCFGSCVDQESDESNCGACGNACDPGEICCGGDCVVSNASNCGQGCNECDSGDLCCAGSCVASNAANCNECGNLCVAGTTCCGATGCKNLQNDPSNCGACDDPVTPGNICTTGHDCAPNQLWCNGMCTTVLDNPEHCGVCNRTCPILNSCQGLQCRLL